MSKARKRKLRQIRRNRRIVILTLVMLCAVGISMGFYNTRATAHQVAFKYYTNYTVERDDTLWSIAQTYCSAEFGSVNSYIKEVQDINNIGTDIAYGQRLVIPYYSVELK